MSQNPEQTIAELQQKIKSLELQLKKAKDSSGYGLKWEEKPEIFEERAQNALPLLREDKSLLIDNKSDLDHIIIEGDNYHALSALNYTHKGMIDVIYIDPPYNTGNKDFIYNDDYVDPEDTYRHSKWISFMNKRLRLAKNLLSDDGVIFISIDDNEQANLKLLCDEIFGENNFQANISRITTKRIKGDVKNINIIHDYILVYSKTQNYKVLHKLREDFSIYEYEDDFINERGKFLLRPLDNRNINYSQKSDYKITAPDGTQIVAGGDENLWNDRQKGKHNVKDRCFRWSEQKLKRGIDNHFIVFKQIKNQWRCYFKIYQFVDNNLQPTEKYESYTSVFDEMYNNQGTSELKDILGNQSLFNYPKPLSLLKNIFLMNKKDSIIIDFFAGSGTTGHAVIELNKQDGGHRKFILCSNRENTKDNPDKNICKNITYERVKRVMQGYTNSKGEKVEGLGGGNLRYYTTEFIEKKKSADDLSVMNYFVLKRIHSANTNRSCYPIN